MGVDGITDVQKMGLWFKSRAGLSLLKAERRIVARFISRFFGYHQVEVLLSADTTLGDKSLLGHRILAVPGVSDGFPVSDVTAEKKDGLEKEGLLFCEPEELPLASDSIDLVILHHTLDVTSQPHQALREASRILRSGGHIVVVGFSPLSSWGIRKLVSRHQQRFWSTRILSFARLEDWLRLLGFQVQEVKHQLFMCSIESMSPIEPAEWFRKFRFFRKLGCSLRLPGGFFYIVQAQKRVAGAIVTQPKWKRRVLTGAAAAHQFTPYRNYEKN